jgi:hypothetical protein
MNPSRMAAFWTLMKDATMTKAEQKPTTPITIWGRRYDHIFLRFLPFFGAKNWSFFKTSVMMQI